MGQPRFLHRGLAVCLAALLGGCGGGTAELLAVADVQAAIYGSGGASSSNYRVANTDPAERGTLTGKVRYAGPPRKPPRVDLSDQFCINAHAQGLYSEEVCVAPDGGLQWVIVYIGRGLVPGMKYAPPSKPAILDQVDCQYVPRALVVQVGQPLVIKSSDATAHNVHCLPGGGNPEFNKSMTTPGELAPRTFDRPQVPLKFKCDIHNWMWSFVAVLPHPCHSVTGADGAYTIPDLPPGTYQLVAWHEKLGEKAVDITIGNRESKTLDITFGQ